MTLAGLIAARKLPLINTTVNSVLSDIPKQNMRITHEVFIELPGEATQEQLNASQALIEAADKAPHDWQSAQDGRRSALCLGIGGELARRVSCDSS